MHQANVIDNKFFNMAKVIDISLQLRHFCDVFKRHFVNLCFWRAVFNIFRLIMETQKARNPNMTPEERIKLFCLISQQKDIVENKKTDGISGRLKEAAWKSIADQFNSDSPSNHPRDCASLKKYFENQKKALKKLLQTNTNELKKTGGGPRVTVLTPENELLLSIVNEKTVMGLCGVPGDSDFSIHNASNGQPIIIDESSICSTNEVSNIPHKVACVYLPSASKDNNNIDKGPEAARLKSTPTIVTAVMNENSIDASDWGAPTPSDLRTPIHHDLQAVKNSKKKEAWVQRRRPISSVITTSAISRKYENLADLKVEVETIKKRKIEAEMTRIDEQSKMDREQHALQMELLRGKIKLQKIQLSKEI